MTAFKNQGYGGDEWSRMKKVCTYLSSILLPQCLVLTIHRFLPLSFAIMNLNGGEEPRTSYLQVCKLAHMSIKSKLALFYNFDMASGFLSSLWAWLPQPATLSGRFVVGLGWVRRCHSVNSSCQSW